MFSIVLLASAKEDSYLLVALEKTPAKEIITKKLKRTFVQQAKTEKKLNVPYLQGANTPFSQLSSCCARTLKH